MAQPQPQLQPWRNTQEGLALLQRIRNNDESLMEVDLFRRGLGDEDAGELAAALQTNSSVRTLSLYENEIGDDGAANLAGVLQNSTITHLALGGNRIRDRGAEAIAQMVHHNSAIKRLLLGGNTIKDEGARALALAVIRNSTLQELYLGGNSIGDGGSEALASAICLSLSLSYLGLHGNRIGERGTRALSTAMRNLGGEGVGQEDAAAFAKGLFVETASVQMGPEELGAIKQCLASGSAGVGRLKLYSGLVGDPVWVKRAGQRNLMRAVIGNGMVRAAVSEKEDHAVLMILKRAGMANGIGCIFEITRAKPGLFKFAWPANNV